MKMGRVIVIAALFLATVLPVPPGAGATESLTLEDPIPLCAFRKCDGSVEIRHCEDLAPLACGDQNGDGEITATDAAALLRAATGECEAVCPGAP
jgi:hypothetical protein